MVLRVLGRAAAALPTRDRSRGHARRYRTRENSARHAVAERTGAGAGDGRLASRGPARRPGPLAPPLPSYDAPQRSPPLDGGGAGGGGSLGPAPQPGPGPSSFNAGSTLSSSTLRGAGRQRRRTNVGPEPVSKDEADLGVCEGPRGREPGERDARGAPRTLHGRGPSLETASPS